MTLLLLHKRCILDNKDFQDSEYLSNWLYKINRILYIHVYPHIYMDEMFYEGKPIFIKSHAVKRARERNIAYPDQVYSVLKTGKIERFGKHGIRWVKKSKEGSIICVGEEIGHVIIIKTIERGN